MTRRGESWRVKDWKDYDKCPNPNCQAPTGSPCVNLSQYAELYKYTPHPGRKRLDRKWRRKE